MNHDRKYTSFSVCTKLARVNFETSHADPFGLQRRILTLTSTKKFKSKHFSAPYPPESQPHADLPRHIMVAPYRSAKEETVLYMRLGKEKPQRLACHRVSRTRAVPIPPARQLGRGSQECAALSVKPLTVCHTAEQQQPEGMGLASRIEDSTGYSHRNRSINLILLKDLEQRVKLHIKKKKGHYYFFPS